MCLLKVAFCPSVFIFANIQFFAKCDATYTCLYRITMPKKHIKR